MKTYAPKRIFLKSNFFKRVGLLFLFLIYFFSVSSAQELTINCIETKDNKNIFGWDYYNSISTNFKEAVIYRKLSGETAYTEIGRTSVQSDLWYTDVDFPTGIKPAIYKVVAELQNGQRFSDSIRNIYTILVQNNLEAHLQWNQAVFHLNATTSKLDTATFYIRRRIGETGPWQMIDSTKQTSYIDHVPQVCKTNVYYQIEEKCFTRIQNSFSNIVSERYNDITPPQIPILDSVSVEVNTQKIVLGWQPSPSPDVDYYKISLDGRFIDSTYNTYYVAQNISITNINLFRVVAFDKCGNQGTLTDPQQNMILTPKQKDCSREISLFWTPYINMTGGLKGYEIYEKNGNNIVLKGSVAAKDTSYTYTVSGNAESVIVLVKAVSKTGLRASSNITTIAFGKESLPEFLYIRQASVNEQNQVELNFYVDVSKPVSNYDIYRFADGETPQKIATLPFSGDPNLSYTDKSINASKMAYNYELMAKDNCYQISKFSEVAKTILLTFERTGGLENTLYWTAYKGWKNIAYYEIYRSTESKPEFVLLGQVPSSETTYKDVFHSSLSFERLTYYVKAVEDGSSNSYHFTDVVLSNQSASVLEGEMFIPTAFIPKGVTNNIFKPAFRFAEKTGYSFLIYNRWGEKVFETKNIDEGWDGKYKGEYVPVGAYVYKIECFFSLGKKQLKTGVVNVLE